MQDDDEVDEEIAEAEAILDGAPPDLPPPATPSEPQKLSVETAWAETGLFSHAVTEMLDLRGKPIQRFAGMLASAELREVSDFLLAVAAAERDQDQRTHLIGAVKDFAEFCRTNSPVTVAVGVLPHEVAELQSGLALVEEWLGRFAVALDDRSRAIVTQPSDKSSVPKVESCAAALAPTGDDLDIPDFLRRHAEENGGTEPNAMQAREGAAA